MTRPLTSVNSRVIYDNISNNNSISGRKRINYIAQLT